MFSPIRPEQMAIGMIYTVALYVVSMIVGLPFSEMVMRDWSYLLIGAFAAMFIYHLSVEKAVWPAVWRVFTEEMPWMRFAFLFTAVCTMMRA